MAFFFNAQQFAQTFASFAKLGIEARNSDIKEKYYNSVINLKQGQLEQLAKHQSTMENIGRARVGVQAAGVNQRAAAAAETQRHHQVTEKAAADKNTPPDIHVDNPFDRGQPPQQAVPAGNDPWAKPVQTAPQAAVEAPAPQQQTSSIPPSDEEAANDVKDTEEDENKTPQQIAASDEDEDDDDDDDDNDSDSTGTVQAAATGGLIGGGFAANAQAGMNAVKQFAGKSKPDAVGLAAGGDVPDDAAPDTTGQKDIPAKAVDDTDTGDKPTQVATADKATKTDAAPTSDGTTNSYGVNSTAIIKNWEAQGQNSPVHQGLLGVADFYRQSGGANGAVQTAQPQQPQKNNITFTNKEMDQIGKGVDPDHQLKDSAGNVAKLDALYQHYMQTGDLKKARAYATGVVSNLVENSKLYGQYAMHAWQQGDHATALKFLKQSYDFIPDGSDLHPEMDDKGNVHAYVTDKDGVKNDLGVFGPDQAYRFISGVANGKEGWSRMMSLGGGHSGNSKGNQQQAPQSGDDEALAGSGPDKRLNFGDQTKMGDSIDQAATTPGADGKPGPALTPDTKNVAQGLLQSNFRNGMSPNDAVRVTQNLIQAGVDPRTAIKRPDGSYEITSQGRQFLVPPNVMAQIRTLRGVNQQAADAEKAKTAKQVDLDKQDAGIKKKQGALAVDEANRAMAGEAEREKHPYGTNDWMQGAAKKVGGAVDTAVDYLKNVGKSSPERTRRAVEADEDLKLPPKREEQEAPTD